MRARYLSGIMGAMGTGTKKTGAKAPRRVGATPLGYQTAANELRGVREARSWTRQKLAKAIGVTPKHVWMIESGACPSVPLLLAIRDALRCSLDDVYPRRTRVA